MTLYVAVRHFVDVLMEKVWVGIYLAILVL